MKIELESLAAELPLQITPDGRVHIDENNDTTNDHKFDIPLSTSIDVITSKEQGGPKIDFIRKTYSSHDRDALRKLFTTRNTSANMWDGTRNQKNYIGSTGVGLDFDGGISIDAVRKMFAPFNYILYTSTSHLVEKHGVVAPRFRLYLPYAPGPLRFTTAIECKKVYFKLLDAIPEIDQAATGPDQQFFPFTGKDPDKFELYVNETGRYFDVDISDVPDDIFDSGQTQKWDGILRPKEELDRIVKFCPFVRWMIANIDNKKIVIHEPLKFALISNLCRFEGGRELIHDILRRDARPEKYSQWKVDAKITWVLHNAGPHRYSVIAQKDRKLAPMWGWQGDNWQGPAAPAGWGRVGRIKDRKPLCPSEKGTPDLHLMHDDNIITRIDAKWSVQTFGELKRKVLDDDLHIQAVCPACDFDDAVVRGSATHNVYLHCDKCDCTYYAHPDAPELFAYGGDLLRVEMKAGRFINHEKLKPVNFRNNTEWDYTCRLVMNDPKRRFIGDSFTINRIGSADFESLGYELRGSENAVVFKYPALPVEVQDNSLIDRFIDGMFREHSDFIKNWMALYSFTNYLSLPVIVLTGARSCGKNTFAEMVGEIFPSLKGTWDGDKEQFNEFAVKKLVFVNENRNSDKPTQYTEIKRLTGDRIVKVNEKNIRQYYVQNNTKFIFATNDPRPIALHWREEPESEKTNNFFIYPCPPLPPDDVDLELFDKLKARLGHYVRTELKQRYEALMAKGIANTRYGLETPITDLARRLFGSSKNLIEMEAEELAQYLVCGIHRSDESTRYPKTIYFQPTKVDGALYVQQQDIRDLVVKLGFKGIANYKAYVTALQDQGVLSHKNDFRVSSQRLGYQILRSPDYYTATVSGIMPVNADATSNTAPAKCGILGMPTTSSGIRIFE
jgi:hypothetical protein